MKTPTAWPATPDPIVDLVVTSSGDTTNAGDGVLTLREAIAEAEVAFKSGQSAVISINVDEPIKLAQGELVIQGTSAAKGVSLTIESGVGEGMSTIDGAGEDGARVLHIADSAAAGDSQLVTLQGLILSGGEADIGGGLLAEQTVLTLSGVAVDSNKALGAAGSTAVLGGGMALIDSQTTMTGGEITGNNAAQGAAAGSVPVLGGGIYVGHGSLAMTGAQVSDNELSTGGESTGGGGIAAVDAKLTLAGVRVADNEIAPVAADGSARGAGIYLSGYAPGSTVSYSSITGNSIGQSSGEAFGGGIHVQSGAVTVDHSYLARNVLGGTAVSEAVAGSAISGITSVLSIENTTIHGNTLTGDNINPPFGTIFASGGDIALLGSTVAGNQAPGGSYAGLYPVSTVPIVRNSIIANATGGGGAADPDVFGAIASNGHNLITQSSVVGAVPGDLLGTDPELGAAMNNGGPTPTMAPLAGSPALDEGADADAVGATDQRGTGFARISGGHTDIGALEAQVLGGPERLFTPGDDVVDLRGVDLARFPGALGSQALAGDDTVRLSTTQNLGRLFQAGRGDDTVIGSPASDAVAGQAGDDRLAGGGGADRLWGAAGADRLHGNGGADTIGGGGGDDRIAGGGAADTMTGGAGADHFRYLNFGDSSLQGRDEITDFSHAQGDKLDFSFMSKAGSTEFHFLGTKAGTVEGDISFAFCGSDTIVTVESGVPNTPDMVIRLDGHVSLVAADFVI